MIGIILIATNKYRSYVGPLALSIQTYFKHDVNIHVLTDKEIANFNCYEIEHEIWPFVTLNRYKNILRYKEYFREDYLFYVDVDTLFVGEVTKEILNPLTAVLHCGYYFGQQGPEEKNKESCFYGIKFPKYYGGGFQGGERDEYLKACEWCYNMIENDVERGIIPVWHDETAWNAYCNSIQEPTELNPSYHYPQSKELRERCWQHDFEPTLLLLDKDHKTMQV